MPSGARRSSRGGAGKPPPGEGERVPDSQPPDAPDKDAAPLFYVDREENEMVGTLDVDNELDQEAGVGPEEANIIAQAGPSKRQRKQNEQQRRRKVDDEAEKDDEERTLERLVFGARDTEALLQGEDGLTPQDTVWEGGLGNNHEDEVEGSGSTRTPAWKDEDDETLWVDVARKDRLRKLRRHPDERDISGADYQERLRARFAKGHEAALDWARLPTTPGDRGDGRRGRRRRGREWGGAETSEEEEEEVVEGDDDFGGLFRSSAPLVVGSGTSTRRRLQPGTLEVARCRDANLQEPSQAVVQAVQFHPSTGGLLFTAGLDKTLRFFQVDGKRNDKVAGVFFQDLPIQAAAFVDGGGDKSFREVVVSGRRPFFYWHDLEAGASSRVPRLMGREEKSLERFVASPDGQWLAFTGKDGYVVLVGARSKQWAGEFKMNGTARALAFSADGRHLMASGGDAVVYRWDLRSRRCLARFHNEGGTVTSALAASAGMLAVGAESGVVNLYEEEAVLGGAAGPEHGPTSWHSTAALAPCKALTHLMTAVDTLAFNHDGMLLAMASKWNRDALRVVHVPSRTVFSNWPTGQTPIRYPSALAFSPNSGMLAVGNDRGRVLLYRLRHYESS
ncbi:u3 small nucleolar rna-associated protein 18 [Nannochloropsis gaditana]|uniref:U3 small nucleolar rna-associated protein 18 n=1 Tax=Nannochloropsis gaditana TaxID=72520 RepID=W7T4E2_9STRA|nr:u3 small nucleolar rna-associated protein 18 [Nannochloropsis gaditana]